MKILLIDAYDSFVHIIYQYCISIKGVDADVIRNDCVTANSIREAQYDLIIFGPGPGNPKDSGYIPLIKEFSGKIPLFGVCLGMQAMVEAFGGKVIRSKNVRHGKVSKIKHNSEAYFAGIPPIIDVTRYHSLAAEDLSFPHEDLDILARSLDDDCVMAIKHKQLQLGGVQFHPESITSCHGIDIFMNVIKHSLI
ncbi:MULTISPECIES: anthranilate synthase component II [Cysteiniphilum]|uniref:Glutamine amidotransferase n=1 Tax=Cysteiniphilum litorale TaxID=2056700 RepID=A0A8J2Z1Q2_9GAMM|nr:MULTISPECIES: aminodeoxychorismate/anthranilate synthase component II [Cysteiniphilum]GGF87903.1 glutamine amidotransferase [Cysteiniphilum litorale]